MLTIKIDETKGDELENVMLCLYCFRQRLSEAVVNEEHVQPSQVHSFDTADNQASLTDYNYGETKFVSTENLGVFGAPAIPIE